MTTNAPQNTPHDTTSLSTTDGTSVGATAIAPVAAESCPIKKPWVRRLGAAAFLFFLIKGLAWLTVPALIVWWQAK